MLFNNLRLLPESPNTLGHGRARWDGPSLCSNALPSPCQRPTHSCPQGVWAESLWLETAWHQLQPCPRPQEKEDRAPHGQAAAAPVSLWAGAEVRAGWGRAALVSPTGYSCTSLKLVSVSFCPFNLVYHKDFPEILNILTTRYHLSAVLTPDTVGLGYMVHGCKAVTPGHLGHFWKKSKGVRWELGEMRPKKAGSRPTRPSTFFGSGVRGARGAPDCGTTGPGGKAMLLGDQPKDPPNLSPPAASKGARRR